MALVKVNAWSEPDRFLSEPDDLKAALRSRAFTVSQLDGYLDLLAARHGIAFPHLAAMARHSLTFQDGAAHRTSRRAIAGFFSSPAIGNWQPVADRSIARALERLGASPAPDLMRDFCEVMFLDFIREFVGCPGGEDARLLELIRTANNVTRPMLSLKALGGIEAAVAELLGYLSQAPGTTGPGPAPLTSYLDARGERAEEGRYLPLAILAGSHTLPQSLAFALYGLLMRDLGTWQAAARPEWIETCLEDLISLFPSTLTLVRIADEDIALGGCRFHAGEAAVLDVAGANARLRRQSAGRAVQHMSFGVGPHKCPGAPLSRMLLARAIPALARAFPELSLQRDGVRFHVTPLVRYPTALPVTLTARSQRLSGRMVEVRDIGEARAIVNDDSAWSPPLMEPYLRALSERSGRDFSTAARIARNAMFFMSGPRHGALRREVAACLGSNRLACWQPFIAAQTAAALDRLATSDDPDLIADFADPLFRRVAQPILGIAPRDPDRFNALAPELQEILEPWLPIRRLEQVQQVFSQALEELEVTGQSDLPGPPLLAHLMDRDLPDFDEVDIKAVVLVLYGASFNLSHTLGNVLHQLLSLPPELRQQAADPQWVEAELEALIAGCASPKYIYRMARSPERLGDLEIGRHETLRLQLLSINRGATTGNLAFGHGLHRCVGAALSKRMLKVAVPALFSRFPDMSLIPQPHGYHDMTQTVALSKLPCRLFAK